MSSGVHLFKHLVAIPAGDATAELVAIGVPANIAADACRALPTFESNLMRATYISNLTLGRIDHMDLGAARRFCERHGFTKDES